MKELTEQEWEDLNKVVDRLNRRVVCDFCCSPAVEWSFEARPFTVSYGPILGHSESGWAACDPCKTLILAHDRLGLVDRGMAIDKPIPGTPLDMQRQALLVAHALFFNHWPGTAPTRYRVQ